MSRRSARTAVRQIGVIFISFSGYAHLHHRSDLLVPFHDEFVQHAIFSFGKRTHRFGVGRRSLSFCAHWDTTSDDVPRCRIAILARGPAARKLVAEAEVMNCSQDLEADDWPGRVPVPLYASHEHTDSCTHNTCACTINTVLSDSDDDDLSEWFDGDDAPQRTFRKYSNGAVRRKIFVDGCEVIPYMFVMSDRPVPNPPSLTGGQQVVAEIGAGAGARIGGMGAGAGWGPNYWSTGDRIIGHAPPSTF